jgi:hypothetical protein
MANDHRGRNVHAGHRTDSDMPNAVAGWAAPDTYGRQKATIAEDVAFERGNEEHPLNANVQQNQEGRWDAEVWRSGDYDLWHEGESQLYKIHEDLNNRLYKAVPEGFRTEYRAKTAASAMLNRRNEGRDHKTGRGPRGRTGSPY